MTEKLSDSVLPAATAAVPQKFVAGSVSGHGSASCVTELPEAKGTAAPQAEPAEPPQLQLLLAGYPSASEEDEAQPSTSTPASPAPNLPVTDAVVTKLEAADEPPSADADDPLQQQPAAGADAPACCVPGAELCSVSAPGEALLESSAAVEQPAAAVFVGPTADQAPSAAKVPVVEVLIADLGGSLAASKRAPAAAGQEAEALRASQRNADVLDPAALQQQACSSSSANEAAGTQAAATTAITQVVGVQAEEAQQAEASELHQVPPRETHKLKAGQAQMSRLAEEDARQQCAEASDGTVQVLAHTAGLSAPVGGKAAEDSQHKLPPPRAQTVVTGEAAAEPASHDITEPSAVAAVTALQAAAETGASSASEGTTVLHEALQRQAAINLACEPGTAPDLPGAALPVQEARSRKRSRIGTALDGAVGSMAEAGGEESAGKPAARAAAKNAARRWATALPGGMPPLQETKSAAAPLEESAGLCRSAVVERGAAVAGSSAAEQEVDAALGAPEVMAAAEAARIVWGRVRGYPAWPAQVMADAEAGLRLEGVRHSREQTLPLIFFGTVEVAWLAPRDVVQWREGLRQGLHTKGRQRKLFVAGLDEVQQFLRTDKKRRAPDNWWCKPPVHHKPKPKQQVLSLGSHSAAHHAPANAALAADAAQGEDELLGTLPGAAARAPTKAVNRAGGATSKLAARGGGVGKRKQKVVQKIMDGQAPSLKHEPYSGFNDDDSLPLAVAADLLPLGVAAGLARRDLPRELPPMYAVPAGLGELLSGSSALPRLNIPPTSAPPAPPPPPFCWVQGEPRVPASPQAFQVPADYIRDRLPQYERLARNLYVSRPRPKRLPKDDIAVCSCRPEPLRPPPSAQLPADGPGEAAPSQPQPPAEMQERGGCGENCLNRLSFIHCDQRLCPQGPRCGNRAFHLLRPPRTETFLTSNRGWGVRAAEPVRRGAFIVEYAGEILDDVECQRRMRVAKEKGEPHFYMMELGPGLIIDAREKGTLARLINSSCCPNCETQKWHDAATGEVRIGIFAMRDIQAGEELTYDYQFQHSGLAAAACAYRCMCGAAECRGTMDTQPERFRDFGKRVEVFWDGDGVFYRGTVTGYSAATRKHTILYDDNDVERVPLEIVPHRWLDEEAARKMSPAIPSPPASVRRGPRPEPFSTEPQGDSPRNVAEMARIGGPEDTGFGLGKPQRKRKPARKLQLAEATAPPVTTANGVGALPVVGGAGSPPLIAYPGDLPTVAVLLPPEGLPPRKRQPPKHRALLDEETKLKAPPQRPAVNGMGALQSPAAAVSSAGSGGSRQSQRQRERSGLDLPSQHAEPRTTLPLPAELISIPSDGTHIPSPHLTHSPAARPPNGGAPPLVALPPAAAHPAAVVGFGGNPSSTAPHPLPPPTMPTPEGMQWNWAAPQLRPLWQPSLAMSNGCSPAILSEANGAAPHSGLLPNGARSGLVPSGHPMLQATAGKLPVPFGVPDAGPNGQTYGQHFAAVPTWPGACGWQVQPPMDSTFGQQQLTHHHANPPLHPPPGLPAYRLPVLNGYAQPLPPHHAAAASLPPLAVQAQPSAMPAAPKLEPGPEALPKQGALPPLPPPGNDRAAVSAHADMPAALQVSVAEAGGAAPDLMQCLGGSSVAAQKEERLVNGAAESVVPGAASLAVPSQLELHGTDTSAEERTVCN